MSKSYTTVDYYCCSPWALFGLSNKEVSCFYWVRLTQLFFGEIMLSTWGLAAVDGVGAGVFLIGFFGLNMSLRHNFILSSMEIYVVSTFSSSFSYCSSYSSAMKLFFFVEPYNYT